LSYVELLPGSVFISFAFRSLHPVYKKNYVFIKIQHYLA